MKNRREEMEIHYYKVFIAVNEAGCSLKAKLLTRCVGNPRGITKIGLSTSFSLSAQVLYRAPPLAQQWSMRLRPNQEAYSGHNDWFRLRPVIVRTSGTCQGNARTKKIQLYFMESDVETTSDLALPETGYDPRPVGEHSQQEEVGS